MKKLYLNIVLSLSIIFGFLTIAYSYPYSGEFINIFDGNDTIATMNSIETDVESWFSTQKGITRDIEFALYDKIDAPDTTGSNMTITYDASNLFGTWATNVFIEFYTVKASNKFALYWIDGGATFGNWTTEHIGVHEISHLSTWNSLTTPTPEPATMLLFGFGLIGLAGAVRKKRGH